MIMGRGEELVLNLLGSNSSYYKRRLCPLVLLSYFFLSFYSLRLRNSGFGVNIIFKNIFYLFGREKVRERESACKSRVRTEGESASPPSREASTGLDPGTPGS